MVTISISLASAVHAVATAGSCNTDCVVRCAAGQAPPAAAAAAARLVVEDVARGVDAAR